MPRQVTIIDTVNKILSKNDTPVKLNEEGVCAGLANLYVRYTLEGRKDEFFQLSKKLAKLPDDYRIGQDSSIDHFIREIEIEFNVFKYTKGQAFQGNMERTVLIDGKPIRKEFSIGLVETRENWASLLEEMKNEGRACFIGSHNHATALSFIEGYYEIYDPNYDEDNEDNPDASTNNTRQFSTAAEAIEELSNQFGYLANSNTGLGIIVYANPNETKPASYPDKKQLLSNYLKSKSDFQKEPGIKHKHKTYNSLSFATYVNDKENFAHYIQHNEISLKDSYYLMLMDSNNDIVFNIYTNETAKTNRQMLISYALWAGNIALFQQMTADYEKTYVTNELQKQEFKTLIQSQFSLYNASESRNPISILSILELYQRYGIGLDTIDEETLKQIITELTKNGDAELLKSFTPHIAPLSEALILSGIKVAAQEDKRGALSFWLAMRDQLPKTPKDTFIETQLLEEILLINFQQLIKAGFKVNPYAYSQALQRNHNDFFELSLSTNPSSVWKGFVQQLKSKSLEEPIDVFSKKEGLSVYQVLISYKENELFKRNWPASVPAQSGIEALEFACKCGNKELVQFLTQQGFKVTSEFQIKQLNCYVQRNDHQRMEAVLSSSINYVEFFTKANKKLITDLIRAGQYQFFINSRTTYRNRDKSLLPVSDPNMYVGEVLSLALMYQNKKLYEYIARTETKSAIKKLKTYLSKDNPGFYSYAIKLAQCLPKESDIHTASPFNEFINEEMHEYDQLLFNRQTKNDEFADRSFRLNARKLIQPLCNLLMHAIEHHYFSFAEELSSQVSLSLDELYNLFIRMNQSKNLKSLEFLLDSYPYLTTNKQVYLKLIDSKEFDLLALLLQRNKLQDNTVYIRLLKAAVRAHYEPIIKLLSAHINSAYKEQGSPMYEAMEEKNEEGCILLLKYNSDVPPLQLFSMAISLPNDRLLQAAFERAEFAKYFQRESTVLLKSLFKNGTPEAILYFYNKMNQEDNQTNSIDYFSVFLNYAISACDVTLFKQLQKHKRFEDLDKMALFELACQHKVPEIVNELLKFPLLIDNEKKLHALFDQLFGLDNKEPPTDAHSIYDLIYQKKLNRLYEFVIAKKYRPFASLFHSIDELIEDSGLSGYKKNHLISRALTEGDQSTLDELLKQMEQLPDLNQDALSLFKNNLHQPLIIRVLLEHYKLNEVLTQAIEQNDWPTVAVLLKDKTSTELDPDLRVRLKQHSADLLKVIFTAAKQSLDQDPRHALNNLLMTTSDLALPDILEEQKKEIQKGIMDIQQMMGNTKIDLKNHFYRFDLYNELVNGYAAIEELTPKIEAFFIRNKEQSAEQMISHELNRTELREFKAVMDTYKLVPAYFEESDMLNNVFDALTDFDNVQHQEQDALLHKQEQDALLQKQEQDALLHKQEQDALLQKQEQDALLHKQEQDALRQQQEQGANQKELDAQKARKADTIQDKSIEKPDTKNKTAQTSPLSGLIDILNKYTKERKQEYFTHFFIPLFQYTRTDKLNAVKKLITAIKDPTYIVTAHDKAVLNNGRLQKRINEYLAENETAIQSDLNLDKPITTVNQLIQVLNKKNPVDKLINILEQYSLYRSIQPETYHFTIFPQYTGSEKRRAAAHLIEHLKGKSGVLDSKDIGALSQGSLGSMINEFIADFKTPLREAFNVKRISNLNDLISASVQPPESPSLGQ